MHTFSGFGTFYTDDTIDKLFDVAKVASNSIFPSLFNEAPFAPALTKPEFLKFIQYKLYLNS
jgi:hypothetical protein